MEAKGRSFFWSVPIFFLPMLYICDRIHLLNNGKEFISQNYQPMCQLFSGVC